MCWSQRLSSTAACLPGYQQCESALSKIIHTTQQQPQPQSQQQQQQYRCCTIRSANQLVIEIEKGRCVADRSIVIVHLFQSPPVALPQPSTVMSSLSRTLPRVLRPLSAPSSRSLLHVSARQLDNTPPPVHRAVIIDLDRVPGKFSNEEFNMTPAMKVGHTYTHTHTLTHTCQQRPAASL